jgi:hypothetical protein
MVYVSGYLVSLFSQVKATDNVQLVPILYRRIGGSLHYVLYSKRNLSMARGYCLNRCCQGRAYRL